MDNNLDSVLVWFQENKNTVLDFSSDTISNIEIVEMNKNLESYNNHLEHNYDEILVRDEKLERCNVFIANISSPSYIEYMSLFNMRML